MVNLSKLLYDIDILNDSIQPVVAVLLTHSVNNHYYFSIQGFFLHWYLLAKFPNVLFKQVICNGTFMGYYDLGTGNPTMYIDGMRAYVRPSIWYMTSIIRRPIILLQKGKMRFQCNVLFTGGFMANWNQEGKMLSSC